MAENDVKNAFLATTKVNLVFAKVVRMMIEADWLANGGDLRQLSCENGHDFVFGIARRLFNCMIKNLLTSVNAQIAEERQTKRGEKRQKDSQSSIAKKAAKLTSKNRE